ncbi:hypothetical protein WLH_01297 [Escherichia coli O25b:H4]|uniref:Uncharacterized protein n=1 Tax=Escherichia coli O25b:H4 TaxID=941280 RepID=A0A192C901_ECO25|nr:hypothetical protein WLH_01297 [Escherichia coli O25b:H4]EGI28590.1 conserved hypothetical protein [Escherichia coli TA206]OSK12439.1 hypothetical protein EAOG_01552 [Escherichia coli R527]OSK24134.1 hypothetical protein EAMG_02204 [Escherichia coli M056]OSK40233.1 hypothetical protein EAHG_00932 [Escherichia coli B671]OSK44096.1 hypothetical protein EAIG_02444 [Escherichia coli B108]OSK53080.1 hypothetical protein EAGG_02093 [Escherichia coli H588]OSK54689.1 hypothetical protein EAFG_030
MKVTVISFAMITTFIIIFVCIDKVCLFFRRLII